MKIGSIPMEWNRSSEVPGQNSKSEIDPHRDIRYSINHQKGI